MDAALAAIVAQGLLLGWSVAWPPGPINAEMIRRALARGFWPAVAVGLGASTGDFAWAVAVALGAGAIADLPGVRPVLGVVSLALLVVLAWTFLRGAAREYGHFRRGEQFDTPTALDSTRGGFLLGLTLALSSPWNIAFWLAVIGQQSGASLALAPSLILATAVVVAAVSWSFVLCGAVRAGARFATPLWQIGTRAATGALMLWFAFRLAVRLAADLAR